VTIRSSTRNSQILQLKKLSKHQLREKRNPKSLQPRTPLKVRQKLQLSRKRTTSGPCQTERQRTCLNSISVARASTPFTRSNKPPISMPSKAKPSPNASTTSAADFKILTTQINTNISKSFSSEYIIHEPYKLYKNL